MSGGEVRARCAARGSGVDLLVELEPVGDEGDTLAEAAGRDGLVALRIVGGEGRHHDRLAVAAERVAQHGGEH